MKKCSINVDVVKEKNRGKSFVKIYVAFSNVVFCYPNVVKIALNILCSLKIPPVYNFKILASGQNY